MNVDKYRQAEFASSKYPMADEKDRLVPASINEVAVGKERLGRMRVVVQRPKAMKGLYKKRLMVTKVKREGQYMMADHPYMYRLSRIARWEAVGWSAFHGTTICTNYSLVVSISVHLTNAPVNYLLARRLVST